MLTTIAAFGRNRQRGPFDETVNYQHEWVISLDGREAKGYLSYPGSRLRPLVVAQLKYRLVNREPQRQAEDTAGLQPYEDFWYHSGKAIGLRRHQNLEIPKGKNGLIIVHSEKMESEYIRAITNAIIRVSLELQRKEVPNSSVLLPDRLFDPIGDELQQYDFRPEMNIPTGPQFSIHLMSNPQGSDRYYYFQKREAGDVDN